MGKRPMAVIPGRKSVLFKTMLIYVGLGGVLVAVLSSLLYARFSANTVGEINKVSTESLRQSMATFDRLWDGLYLYMNKEFRSDATLIEGMTLDAYSPVESSRIGEALNDIIDTNSAIESVYLYNEAADVVFSNYGTATTCDSFYDDEITRMIGGRLFEVSTISDSAILYRKMHYQYGSINQNKNVITVVFSTDDLKTALIFNIDQSLLQDLVVPKGQQAGQNLLIINREGVIVSDSEPSRIYSDLSGEPYVQQILASTEGTGYFIETVGGRKSLVTYSYWDRWETLGWVFVRVADYDSLIGDLKQLQTSVLLVTAAFIAIGIATAALLLRGVFQPFYRLIDGMRSRNPYEPAKMSEIEYLGTVYNDMATDLESLTTYKDSSRQVLQQEFLNRLLHPGKQPLDGAEKLAATLGLRLSAEKYRVIAFRPDHAAGQQPESAASEQARAAIAAAFTPMDCQITQSADGTLVVIMGLSAGGQPPVVQIKEAQEACLRQGRLSFTVGIGTVEDGIAGIQFSWRTAMEATALRLVYGRGAVIDYSAEALARRQSYRYPIELEKQILDAVRLADVDRFSQALNEFAAAIESFTHGEILLALDQMTMMLIRSLKAQLEVTHMQEVGVDADYREVDAIIRSSETMGDIRKFLVEYMEQCTEAVRTRKSSRHSETIEMLQRYIADHLGDAGLTVDRIAEHVNLSPNYMRSLFKDHTGMSVSHYLNDLRFRQAAELLVTTTHPASRIAGMVGFPEGSYFYSAFKNAMGMTPEEYRRHNRPEEE